MSIFQKFSGNPVVTPEMFPDDIMYVFNPGAVKVNGEYLLLVDAATAATPIVFWLARSRDGVHFTIDPEPVECRLSLTGKLERVWRGTFINDSLRIGANDCAILLLATDV